MDLFNRILKSRGIVTKADKEAFLNPTYQSPSQNSSISSDGFNPFLLPDMTNAVDRLIIAKNKGEKIVIYGDYDIDGLTATTVLLDGLTSLGFLHLESFIPNRFEDGYGLSKAAIEKIASKGANLIITVDCGSLSHQEIKLANNIGLDVIVTDHHNVAPKQPPAVAVINPKRLLQDYPDEYQGFCLKSDSKMKGKIYPFLDLPGVGVAFKLVQALQTKLSGLAPGQEKWLLDLVALGTVCDVVSLVSENRINVYWGLKVMVKTRRLGLKALVAVSRLRPSQVDARSLGFVIGPRMNAAGRLETAEYSLELLTATDPAEALKVAKKLDELNAKRRKEQDLILSEATAQAETLKEDNVLVVSSSSWNQGIVGIVAAKLIEKFKKPSFVLSILGDETKGSARSFGDFSVADAIRSADDVIKSGGGHKFAAGVTLPSTNLELFRQKINSFYKEKKLTNQASKLLPKADTDAKIGELTLGVIDQISSLEPFGNANPEPVLTTTNLTVVTKRLMGDQSQHIKLTLQNTTGEKIDMLAFSAPDYFFVDIGDKLTVWYNLRANSWNGNTTVEGYLLHLEVIS